MSFKIWSVVFLCLLMCGCGTHVPSIEEVWEQKGGTVKSLERKIKEQVYCELAAAVHALNTDPKKAIIVDNHPKRPLPQDWGVTMVLTMTVLENTGLNPNDTLIRTLKTVGGTAESLSYGIGGTFSSDATRLDKFTFFYLVKDLEVDTGSCTRARSEADMHGSSFLLESNLEIYDWIDNATTIRASAGVPRKSKQEALSYDVKFDVVTSANFNPTLKLVHNTFTGATNLLSTKRDRTHELQLTFGPADPATLKDGKVPQPGTIAAFDSLSLQVGSAVSGAIRSLRDQQ